MKINTRTIKKMAEDGERLDGRKMDEYREIELETDYIPTTAQGSAKVSIGDTQVIAGLSVEVEEPYPDQPNRGSIAVNAELAPMADREFESGPPGEKGTELARVVDRGIRESEAVDFEDLCIEPGEKVMTIFIDLHILNNDGNLLDASALAAIAALQTGYLPAYSTEDREVNHEEKWKDIPMTKEPVMVTGRKIDDQLLWDTTSEEEEAQTARLSVTTTAEGMIVSMQKGGREELTHDEIRKIMDQAEAKTQEIREVLREETGE
ncbi:MAG: exosome complex protein Rrp42 [Candidatus Nanohalobium sp.]